MMDNRQKVISEINSLYPADSNYSDTAEIGKGLLMEAIFKNWQSLPTKILVEYKKLCQIEESK